MARSNESTDSIDRNDPTPAHYGRPADCEPEVDPNDRGFGQGDDRSSDAGSDAPETVGPAGGMDPPQDPVGETGG